jgi:hypothetical protein
MSSLNLDGLLDTDGIDAWRPTERKLISTTSTQGARSSGCTWSFVCWGPK